MNDRTQAEAAIFEAALTINDLEKRQAMLDAACHNDAELRQRVDQLLAANADANSFMQQPAGVLADETTSARPTEKPGTIIGRYKLLEQIGEGGFGVVYMADQLRPIERRVALKIIKLGMDSKQVVARFEAERQALALMDHPNIAKILDAGTTDSGRPYFIMELVRGIPVTEYCDDRGFTTEERLKLFSQICSAVQHAHQKGIIHRDLKPNNILVSTNGDEAVPKVIDFGIAKATQGRLTDKTLFTQFRQFIGTPAYMSPEQAQMSAVDVDTRSDIYSLGVLLYELLTGRTPLDSKSLVNAGYEEICRRVREEEALKPSKRLSSLQADELTTLAKQRKVAASQFTSSVSGDLDWIVMKAVEKDRARRYETCGALVDDVQRYLNRKPVVAAPPSAAYQLKKFWLRNRALLTTVATISTVLVASTVALAFMFLHQRKLNKDQRELVIKVQEREAEADLQRQVALGNLTHALIGEARALRLARHPGYRTEAWSRLQKALALDVADLPVEEIRREAVLMMGDYYGTTITWRPDQRIECVAVSPTRDVVSVAFEDGSLVICRLPDCTEIARLSDVGEEVQELNFNKDGRLLFCMRHGQADTSCIELWKDQGNDQWAMQATTEFDALTAGIAVSPQADVAAITLVSAEDRSQLAIWSPAEQPKMHTLSEGGSVGPVAFSPDGQRIVVAHETGEKKIRGPSEFSVWDIKENKITKNKLGPSLDGITALEFDPTGKLLGCVAHGGVEIYRSDDYSPVMRAEGLSNSRSVCFDRFGHNFSIVNDQENQVAKWNLSAKQAKAVLPHLNEPQAALMSRDDEYLVVWGARAVRVWRTAGTREKKIYAEYGLGVPGMAYSDDGSLIATAHKSQLIRVWDVKSRRLVRTLDTLSGPRQTVCISPDRKLLVTSGYSNGSISIWDAHSSELLLDLDNDCGRRVWSCGFAPDGRHFGAAGNAGVNLWRIKRGTDNKLQLEKLDSPLLKDDPNRLVYNSRHVAFSPNGKLFGWSEKNGVQIWDIEAGEARPSPAGKPFNPIQNLSFLNNNRDFVFLTPDRHAEVWNTKTGSRIQRFDVAGIGDRTVSSYACKMALSPNSRWLAVSSLTGRSINIWNLKNGELDLALPEESAAIWRLCWAPDSARISAACGTGSIVTWDLDEVRKQVNELVADQRLSSVN